MGFACYMNKQASKQTYYIRHLLSSTCSERTFIYIRSFVQSSNGLLVPFVRSFVHSAFWFVRSFHGFISFVDISLHSQFLFLFFSPFFLLLFFLNKMNHTYANDIEQCSVIKTLYKCNLIRLGLAWHGMAWVRNQIKLSMLLFFLFFSFLLKSPESFSLFLVRSTFQFLLRALYCICVLFTFSLPMGE